MRVRRRTWAGYVSALALLLGPTAALACPTAEAMSERGVLLTTADGNIELHQQTRPNIIQVAVNFGGGDGSVLEMQHGIYLKRKIALVDGVLDPNTEETYMSTRTAEAWDAPAHSQVWQNARAGGGSAASSAQKTIRIGTCRYPGFDVSIRLSDDPGRIETYAYLPELGIGLWVQTDDNGAVKTYRYVSITAY